MSSDFAQPDSDQPDPGLGEPSDNTKVAHENEQTGKEDNVSVGAGSTDLKDVDEGDG